MDLGRWKQIRALSEAAAEQAPERRHAWLLTACDDEDLRNGVLSLLADREGETLVTALPSGAGLLSDQLLQQTSPVSRLGQRFGVWRLAEPLGEGGMGEVYLATREEGGFTQRVALKLMRAGLGAADVLERFRFERQILAGLEHPNIARLVDGGAGPGGEPYLALEFVEGKPLREYCDTACLDLPTRLRMFLTVCQAVAYAHERLVVHRDLKPSNILVTARGEVKLLDFGIAKLLDSERASETTMQGQRLFTPEYAAPEQILGEPVGVTADVYALGVVLFELLTGQRPHRGSGASAAGIEQAVLNDTLRRPSSVVTERAAQAGDDPHAVARARATEPRTLRRLLRGDLDAIVLKALRRQPGDRYPTVRALAEDVLGYLERRPVAARRGDRRYRTLRFLQRHALAVGLVGLAGLSLVLGLGVALWQAHEARSERALAQLERDAARRQALTAEKTLDFMKSVFQLADPGENLGQSITALDLLAKGSRDIEQQLFDEPQVRIGLVLALAEAYLGLAQPEEARDLLDSALQQARAAGDPVLEGEVMFLLGAARGRLGDVAEAESITRQALQLPLGPDARGESLRARLELRLAVRLADRSAYDEAESLYATGFDRFQRATGHIAQDYVIPYSSLLNATGKRQQAETLLRDALAEARERLPPVHPSRAALSAQLANNLSRQGRRDEAEPLMREALGIKLAIYGEDHPSPDLTAHNLASLLGDMGRFEEAETIARGVLERALRRFGADHDRTAATQNALAKALLNQGRHAEAEPIWRAAHTTAVLRFGASDNASASTALGLGRSLMALQRWDEAQDALATAERIYLGLLPHAAGGLARSRLELLRLSMSRSEARPDCAPAREAWALFSEQAQPMGEGYAQAVLAECLQRSDGAPDELRSLLQTAAAALRAAPGPGWPETAYAEALLKQAR